MENLADRIKKQLRLTGKSQKELAEFIGVSEYGLIKMMQRGTLKSEYMSRMMKFLNVDLNFFGFESKKGSDNMKSSPKVEPESTKNVDDLERIIESQKQTIESQRELIATLKEKLNVP